MNFRRGKSVNVVMNYGAAKEYVHDHGYDEFMNVFSEEFPGYDFGSASTDWEETDEFICKLRGDGDIIIGWDGIHE
jgi:hypothetical protein